MPRTLLVHFAEPIAARELSAFRGAVIAAVGPTADNVLFHQHQGTGFRYAYPLIQYKRLYGCPALLCLENGADELHKLFQQESQMITINGRTYPLEVADLRLLYEDFSIEETSKKYLLQNWAPLNQKNHEIYLKLTNEEEKQALLTCILVGNLLAAAKGLGIFFESKIEARIIVHSDPRVQLYKKTRLLVFDVQFVCNLSLPRYMGLGQHAGWGFGITKPIFKKTRDIVQHDNILTEDYDER